MHFAIYCTDSPDGDRLRETHMEAHLAHIKSISDRLMLAGPCPPDAENALGASVLVLEAPDLATARRIAESDPYCKGGVWDTVVVREFKPVVGQWAPKQTEATAAE